MTTTDSPNDGSQCDSPYSAPVSSNRFGKSRRITPFRAWLTTITLTSLGPLVALKIYIRFTGDIEARWLIIAIAPFLVISWALFLITLAYCLVLVIRFIRTGSD